MGTFGIVFLSTILWIGIIVVSAIAKSHYYYYGHYNYRYDRFWGAWVVVLRYLAVWILLGMTLCQVPLRFLLS